MARLIQKSGILRSGGSRYLRYIATREGVEKLAPESGYMAYIAQRPGRRSWETTASSPRRIRWT